MVKNAIQAKTLKYSCSYATGTITGNTLRNILRAWKALAKAANPSTLTNMVAPYIFFYSKKKQFHILSTPEQGFAPLEQSCYLLHGQGTINSGADVNTGMCNRLIQSDSAIWFVSYHSFNHFALKIINNSFYIIQEGWTWFAQYRLQTNKLPALFQSHLSAAANASGVALPSPPATVVINVERVAPKMRNTDVMIG